MKTVNTAIQLLKTIDTLEYFLSELNRRDHLSTPSRTKYFKLGKELLKINMGKDSATKIIKDYLLSEGFLGLQVQQVAFPDKKVIIAYSSSGNFTGFTNTFSYTEFSSVMGHIR